MSAAALHAHLASGETRVCQCWALRRADGVVYGFTDHDQDLNFDGVTFQADSGMTARALASSTGLSVNNTEALGILQSALVNEADILAGRYDDARVTIWLVRWDEVSAREVRFEGSIGEISRTNGGFEAELRGLTDALNQPQGRTYLPTCSAVLGDQKCRFNLSDPAYRAEVSIASIGGGTVYRFAPLAFAEGWLNLGVLTILEGEAAGLSAVIKDDRSVDGGREVTLWAPLPVPPTPGQPVRLDAGCDKRKDTCVQKFANLINFQGFPHVPGEDWLMAVPRSDGSSDGGSLQ